MPIERRYDQPGLDTMLSALLIQQQQKKAERERAAATAQAMAGMNGAANGQPTGYSTGPQGPAYAPTNRVSVGYPRARGRLPIDITRLIGESWNNNTNLEIASERNYANLLQTQMAKDAAYEQALMQQAAENERNSLNQAIGLSKQYTDDIPQYIQEGLDTFQIRYNPIIQREINKESEERARILADKRLRDSEKAWAVAEKDRQIRWLRMQTEPFPPNERPLSPQQIAVQNTWTEKDAATGLDVEYQNETRNGGTRKVATDSGKAVIDNWLKQQESQRKIIEDNAKAANAPPKETFQEKESRDQRNAHRSALYTELERNRSQAEADYATVVKLQAERDAIPMETTADRENNQQLYGEADAKFQAARAKSMESSKAWSATKDRLDHFLAATHDMLAEQSGQVPVGPPAQQPVPPQQPQAAPQVASPQDAVAFIRANKPQPGTVIMTPSGPYTLTQADIDKALQ